MSDTEEEKPQTTFESNAPGSRNKPARSDEAGPPAVQDASQGVQGLGLGGAEIPALKSEDDVKGNLKIHIKLALDVDVRVIAKIRGEIAIGIL